ncbi:MAG: class I SAM-dependent methyltransferase [Rickettsiaceae bacterium]|nr:class I SAM-dependent methyltransferase [Rickettsiaceae bacterium]
MNSDELGLPIEYQQYPEFFDNPANANYANAKNKAIEELLNKYNAKSVLDLTCGTGSQVFHLTNLGYKVTGSDFSPKLLEIARDKASNQKLNIPFVDGDMRSSQLGQFDAVITIDNAIGHLVKSDFEVAIRNIGLNLKDGGIYIFDILDLKSMTDEVIDADSKRVSDKTTINGVVISNLRQATIDRNDGILTSNETITIQKGEDQKTINNRSSLQIYTVEQLNKILSGNGFKTIEQFKIDTYTFNKDNDGYAILTVAKKQ